QMSLPLEDMTPTHNNAVLERIVRDEISKGGIYIGEKIEQATAVECVVIGVGEYIVNDEARENPVKVGDTVLVMTNTITEFKLEGLKCAIVKIDDILAVRE
ncbi:MAG: co-chaperone GroES family protein, partial [Candidatus Saccharimonadales bacterium]